MNAKVAFIEHKAYALRVASVVMTTMAGSGHPTSCLSAADLVAAIFFYAMNFDPQHHDNPDNDRFILSSGHDAPLLYAVYKELGLISEQDLAGYRSFLSPLEGHPTRRFAYAEVATGSLGIGLSVGLGIAKAAKMDQRDYKTYVLLGDAESSEGSVWEAAALAHHYRLNNLIAVLNDNRLGQSEESLHGHHVHRYEEKFKAFGWKVIVVDGHDMQALLAAFDSAKQQLDNPVIIIAKTIKGYGIKQVADKQGYHGKPFSKEELHEILQQLADYFAQAHKFQETPWSWHQKNSLSTSNPVFAELPVSIPAAHYKKGDQIATRESYGKALAAVGRVCPQMVVLDADVKNSTYTELFEQKFSDRFVQCFVAEQNMIGMALGFESRKKIPFASTFGSFMTRAYDQIRMAGISQAALRLCGSHAGISIGQDGPSQMALEDIAIMRCVPDSVVLYPCDAVSTHKLVEQMVNYTGGISYMRTTRPKTPVLYDLYEEFPLGGLKILRQSEQDIACIVGAGITVFEALKAYELLVQEDIYVAVIDLYSAKPLDTQSLAVVAKKSCNLVITVEDHYLQGGIGEAVAAALVNDNIRVHSLAIKQLPRSGPQHELMRSLGIDAQAIVELLKGL